MKKLFAVLLVLALVVSPALASTSDDMRDPISWLLSLGKSGGGKGPQGEPGPMGPQGTVLYINCGENQCIMNQTPNMTAGPPGPTGPQGLNGTQGIPGEPADIFVNSTITVEAGENAYVVDSDPDPGLASLDFEIPRGYNGTAGAKGDPGTAATITVNYTFTGASGTPALVTNIGTQYAALLDFTIPQGPQGPAGGAPTSTYSYYTLPFQALTSSPGDGATNYMGSRPIAPSTTAGTNKMYIPTNGVIERAEVYDYSGTAGTNEVWQYFIRKNNAGDTRIANVSAATNERVFSNTALSISVAAGDYIEIKRINPTWATNPLTNIVGGYVFINTTVQSGVTAGYTLPVQALTTTPTDSQTVYFGNLPKAPTTTAATSKIYIPKSGNITRAEIYCYSGTAGTAESWTLYVRKNNSGDTTIDTVANSASERIFRNAALNIAVSAGDYVEIKGVQPAWATNPATTIYGGYLYVTG